MSGISGIVNPKYGVKDKAAACTAMTGALCRTKNKNGIKNAVFENAVFSSEGAVEKIYDGKRYFAAFDGEIYNRKEIEVYLSERSMIKGNEGDAELVLNLYLCSPNGFLKKINGIFSVAVWNESLNELVLARDRFGIKPLYYSVLGGTLYFSSEIKGLLASGDVKPVIKKDGILHMFSIGPAVEQGNGVLSGIYEIPPSTVATYSRYGVKAYRYWNLESKRHTDSFEETCERVEQLVSFAVKSQIKATSKKPCFFLSGGLDSSIITALGAEEFPQKTDTFSVRYAENEDFFVPNGFQPASDDGFIELMSKHFSTNHTVVEISREQLFERLFDAVTARDCPGMADIDSSLLIFCEKIGENYQNAMSGECADEVFGGYPWFYKKDLLCANTFPWSTNTDIRENIINKNIAGCEEVKNYIGLRYQKSTSETPVFGGDTKEEMLQRQMSHINLNWFMYSLGARSERCGAFGGVNIRMPFCDYKLIEYVWNIPYGIKAAGGREKGILREAFKKRLPEEIFLRKKSPYPKTHHPKYEALVRERLKEILSGDTPLKKIADEKYIWSLLEEKSDYAKPWFGQLMALPQLFGYLLQIDFWLKKYKIKIDI